ncbi:hypothetical protein HBI04_060630 [Parastagonospora nodorum]|nr:hypothetical protein HBI03_052980 [Parastagonospora nodorum]KAH4280433.1 hypothetical protein HBI04_060630 [Parastagonospora nodorum]KAH5292051.1 hypothetical protein HBI11_192930 [Parastagonospora nodorum]
MSGASAPPRQKPTPAEQEQYDLDVVDLATMNEFVPDMVPGGAYTAEEFSEFFDLLRGKRARIAAFEEKYRPRTPFPRPTEARGQYSGPKNLNGSKHSKGRAETKAKSEATATQPATTASGIAPGITSLQDARALSTNVKYYPGRVNTKHGSCGEVIVSAHLYTKILNDVAVVILADLTSALAKVWPSTAQNFCFAKHNDGMNFEHRDGKVDSDHYGGGPGMDFYLCFVTFCTGNLCFYGSGCRYRHAKLEYLEALAIASLGGQKGAAFLAKYRTFWAKPSPPTCSGFPQAPGIKAAMSVLVDVAAFAHAPQVQPMATPVARGGATVRGRGSGRGGRGGNSSFRGTAFGDSNQSTQDCRSDYVAKVLIASTELERRARESEAENARLRAQLKSMKVDDDGKPPGKPSGKPSINPFDCV